MRRFTALQAVSKTYSPTSTINEDSSARATSSIGEIEPALRMVPANQGLVAGDLRRGEYAGSAGSGRRARPRPALRAGAFRAGSCPTPEISDQAFRAARAVASTAAYRLEGAAIALDLSLEQCLDDRIGLGQALADLGPVDREQYAVLDRHGGCRTRVAVEDRHLAEQIPGLQAAQHDPRAADHRAKPRPRPLRSGRRWSAGRPPRRARHRPGGGSAVRSSRHSMIANVARTAQGRKSGPVRNHCLDRIVQRCATFSTRGVTKTSSSALLLPFSFFLNRLPRIGRSPTHGSLLDVLPIPELVDAADHYGVATVDHDAGGDRTLDQRTARHSRRP